jgi:hypothetical protein
MQVRIYRLPKTAMQAGRGLTKQWVLEFEPGERKSVDPLMGWTSSRDTRQQLRLWFDNEAEAIAYAQQRGLMYSVEPPRERNVKPKAYADNFKYNRILRWTH